MSCINCKHDFEGLFCPTCGEKQEIPRITFGSTISSIYSGFLDMDKGFLYNLKNLTIAPKDTILQYINGKRKYILNPVSYAIITISIYLLLDSLLPRGSGTKLSKVDPFGAEEMGYKLGAFMGDKMKFLWLTLVLYLAFFTRLFFRKYNYFEHIAINSFILGHATIIAILTRLIFNRELIIFNFIVFFYVSILLYKVFKNPKDPFGTKALSILIVFFSYLLFIGFPFIIANFML